MSKLSREQVERFDEGDCPMCHMPGAVDVSDDGALVRYVDYAALRAKLEASEHGKCGKVDYPDGAVLAELRRALELLVIAYEAIEAPYRQLWGSAFIQLPALTNAKRVLAQLRGGGK